VFRNQIVWGKVFASLIRYRNKIVKSTDEELLEIVNSIVATLKKSAKVDIEIHGEENLPKDTGYLFVSNHQTRADVVFVFDAIQRKMAFIAKDELENWFYIGRYIRRMGGELIDREDVRSQLASINSMIDKLKNKEDVFIFPEGTCSHTIEMGEFKAGTFKIAMKSKAPIVPIVLHDSYKVLTDDKNINPGTAKVSILPAINYEEYKGMKSKQIAEYVKTKMNEKLFENEKDLSI
jgi:1-acyl-sn-glycerol-3-phosphate acyltransferase